MRVKIESVKSTDQRENFEVIERCVNAISSTKTLVEAFIKIQNEINTIVFWKCGRGSNHIWVSNYKNERLLLITEYDKPKTLDDVFESDLFKKMEAEDEKALKESGWTRKEIDQIANFIIKKQS